MGEGREESRWSEDRKMESGGRIEGRQWGLGRGLRVRRRIDREWMEVGEGTVVG